MGDPGSYRTVAGKGRASFEVGGSEFVGIVTPVRTVGEAEAFLESVATEYADATHLVPAYRIWDGALLREWSSDADEPAGTAGKPALNVLQQRDIRDIAVAIVRYFGGTELGVGGLARAYARATTEAIDASGIVETEPQASLLVTVDYDDSGTVRGLLEREGAAIEASYGERAQFEVVIPKSVTDELCDQLLSATSGRADIDRE